MINHRTKHYVSGSNNVSKNFQEKAAFKVKDKGMR